MTTTDWQMAVTDEIGPCERDSNWCQGHESHWPTRAQRCRFATEVYLAAAAAVEAEREWILRALRSLLAYYDASLLGQPGVTVGPGSVRAAYQSCVTLVERRTDA